MKLLMMLSNELKIILGMLNSDLLLGSLDGAGAGAATFLGRGEGLGAMGGWIVGLLIVVVDFV